MILNPLLPVSDLIVEGMSERQAKAIQTTAKRGDTLKADGYEFVRTERNGVYHVFKPAKLNKVTGELLEFSPYIVDVQAVREALELLIGGSK